MHLKLIVRRVAENRSDSEQIQGKGPTLPEPFNAGNNMTRSSQSDRRCTRGNVRGGKRTLAYDCLYHPLDELIRPVSAAKRRRVHGIAPSRSYCRSQSRKTNAGMGTGLSESSPSKRKLTPPGKSTSKSSTSPPIRRSPRFADRSDINYDTKVHPADAALGLGKYAKRRHDNSGTDKRTEDAPRSGSPDRSSSSGSDVGQPTESAKKENDSDSADEEDGVEISENSELTDWYNLSDLDRRLFILQQSRSLDVDSPMRWECSAATLIAEGLLTRESLQRSGGLSALARRYQEVEKVFSNTYGFRLPGSMLQVSSDTAGLNTHAYLNGGFQKGDISTHENCTEYVSAHPVVNGIQGDQDGMPFVPDSDDVDLSNYLIDPPSDPPEGDFDVGQANDQHPQAAANDSIALATNKPVSLSMPGSWPMFAGY